MGMLSDSKAAAMVLMLMLISSCRQTEKKSET